MIDRIVDEIKKSIENECFLSAIVLALTLPDACGRAAFDSCKGKVGERYVNWFDSYVLDVSGNLVYKLRNSLMHQITPGVEFEEKDVKWFQEQCIVDDFKLVVANGGGGWFSGVNITTNSENNTVEYDKREIHVDLIDLSLKICDAAIDYYNNNQNKFGFITQGIYDIRESYDCLFPHLDEDKYEN